MRKFKWLRFKKLRLRYRRGSRYFDRRLKKHVLFFPVVGLITLLTISIFLYVVLRPSTLKYSDAHNIVFYHDNIKEDVPTRATTVGEFLIKFGITLNEGDVVEPAKVTAIVEDNFRINVYRAQPVVVFDSGHRLFALSAASTPRSVASQIGLTVYPEDILTTEPSNNFTQDGIGQKITINRATPVNLNLYGTPLALRTHAKTVRALLAEKNVILAKDDNVSPAQDTPISAQSQVFVNRNGIKLVTEEAVIATPIQIINDNNLTFGTSVVRQNGSPGKKSITYQLDLKNGKEVGRHVIQEVVVVEAVAQIVAHGQAVSIPSDKESIMAAVGIGTGDYAYANYIISHESGWCVTKWQGQVGFCPAFYTDLHSVNSSFGYGLCQSTPAAKMASAGSDWQTSAITQMRWCNGYALGRYGSWAAAYNHWVANANW